MEGQVGFVAALGDEVVGAEAIGRPEVFARAFPALLHGYAVDAIDAAHVRARDGEAQARGATAAAVPRFDSPEAFLDSLAAAPASSGPSLGLGDDVRLEGPGVAGCALVAGDLVHLTAFPREGAN